MCVCPQRKQCQLAVIPSIAGRLITSLGMHTKSMGRKTKHILILFLSILCWTRSQRVCWLRPERSQRDPDHHHQTGSRTSNLHRLVPSLGHQDVGNRPAGQNSCCFFTLKSRLSPARSLPTRLPSCPSCSCYCCFVFSQSFSANNDVITVNRLNGCNYALTSAA